jgi:glycosyltransferase involved in cell wall biosynthesis
MRILHVLGGLDRGGVETWLVQVLRNIDRSRFQFDFLVHTKKHCAYDDEVRELGSRIIPCPSHSEPLKYAHNFFRILRDDGPFDCVHSHVHHFSGYVMLLARLAGVPMRIAHSHNDTRRAESRSGLLRRAYLASMSLLLQHFATAGLSVGHEAHLALFGHPGDARWEMQFLGIDLKPYEASVDSAGVRAKLGIPCHHFVVGHIGRFSEQKNHAFVIEIAKAMAARRPDVTFLLVGDGSLRSDIERRIAEYGLKESVKLTGVISNVPEVLKGAIDVFVFPSLHEGLPLTLLEVQAASVPAVISSDTTTDSIVVPSLITRVDLAATPDAWASALLRLAPARERARSIHPALYARSIGASADRLTKFYTSRLSSDR